MAYVALYRKWRPQDFDTLIGQEHVSVTLKNAIAADKIAHAYLFSGPRGTGKTSTAKILAKSLNCLNGPTPNPCNQCSNCQRITTGTSMDVFEIDAASNRGIDEIRDLRETVKFAPVDGRYKVYIIDEVHMLTTEAFNALLKTLEEPPAHVIFVLATTEPHKIPATIHSRCQRYDFRRIGVADIEKQLTTVAVNSGLNADAEALRLIAVQADGGMRDALSILDQCAAAQDGVITPDQVRRLLGLIGHEWVWQITEGLAKRDTPTVLVKLDELINLGKDIRQLLVELTLHFRSLMLYKAAPDLENIEMYSDDKRVLSNQSAWFSHEELVRILEMLHTAANEARWAQEPRIVIEMTFISICRRTAGSDLTSLIERVAALEAKLANASALPVAAAAAKPQPSVVRETPAIPVVPPKGKKVSPPARPEPAKEPQVREEVPASLTEIWAAVLKELLTTGKRSVHACVMQGQLASLTDNQAVVRFTAGFPKERTEKDDFRLIVEKVLAQVSGQQVRLTCTLGQDEPARPALPSQESSARPQEVEAAEPGEEHPAVQQARILFGGKIIKIDDTNQSES
ncbi:MAG TPA: DNA polymerase III subunit gamma/tau [Methylomusa anaerophila]|uniref:DNA-directed DNA polymerase n=1 Tax=Methylomusa anaerophila TaxID=1930071 RepID=A0A348AIE9_9FIRM|nr:DNA polymerase III subunit gamma/tau [Methylomusa anaerophila]BBB90847.1 DNA polymerase III subunit tau [Methylomusa anaerophila]HML90641.1 DNA polymerase III subunit gamma/tau [Methylomusa anaerophila]